jgi:dihydroorotate dehydrogenase electron transfer subunit
MDLEAPLVARGALSGPFILLTFRHPAVAAEARAGQFVMMRAEAAAVPLLRRPFSIMAVDPSNETFTVFLKVVGPGSYALAALEPDDLACCLGPLGRPFTAPPPDREALLIAGGFGIAPFHLFSQELRALGGKARVFYGGRTASDLVLREPFDRLDVPLTPSTDDGSLGRRGLVTEAVEEYLAQGQGAAMLYACGPQPMLRAVARLAQDRGLPAQLSLDPWMGCGMGTCLGCVVPIQRPGEERPSWRCACTEGPVFDAREVVWEARP